MASSRIRLHKETLEGEPMTKHIANILTVFRIFGSLLLLLFPVFTPAFYAAYLLCGFSDMIDGTIARKTNSVSEFGSKLDTAADLAFVIAASMKLLPTIRLSLGIWIWSGSIALIKISSIVWGSVSGKQFIALHTILNKAAGLLLFLLPFTVSFVEVNYSAIVACSVATLAALQEWLYIIKGMDINL